MRHNSVILVWLAMVLSVSAANVRVTVRNLTGSPVRFQDAATNAVRFVFPLGESIAEVPESVYSVLRVDSDTAATFDSGTDSSGFIVQVNEVSLTEVALVLVDSGSPLQWALWGMGLGAAIGGVAWGKRKTEQVFKAAME